MFGVVVEVPYVAVVLFWELRMLGPLPVIRPTTVFLISPFSVQS